MKRGHNTAFYLETLLLIVVFICIILVLTQVFALSKAQSSEARLLTNAVTLSEKAAEALSASRDTQELCLLLNENGNAFPMADTAGVEAFYTADLSPSPEGRLRVSVTWLPAAGETGTLVRSVIYVTYADNTEPLYRLETEVYLREGET